MAHAVIPHFKGTSLTQTGISTERVPAALRGPISDSYLLDLEISSLLCAGNLLPKLRRLAPAWLFTS
jgi:hypothetical protein